MKAILSILLVTFIANFAFAVNLCDERFFSMNGKKKNSKLAKKLISATRVPASDQNIRASLSPEKWQLVWNDEFNQDGKLDPKKWLYEVKGDGFGNAELQYYTDRLSNSRAENGNLIIEAKKESYGGREYTSARLNSNQGWTYGRYEFRGKMTKVLGTWYAAWLLPSQMTYSDRFWPDNGEIDIMEGVGFENNVNYGSAHSKNFSSLNMTFRNKTIPVPDGDQQFHVYALEWYPSRLDFYVDDNLYFSVKHEPGANWEKDWPYDHDFHIILNLAVGGNWGGNKGIDEAAFEKGVKFVLDYARVFRPLDPNDCAEPEEIRAPQSKKSSEKKKSSEGRKHKAKRKAAKKS